MPVRAGGRPGIQFKLIWHALIFFSVPCLLDNLGCIWSRCNVFRSCVLKKLQVNGIIVIFLETFTSGLHVSYIIHPTRFSSSLTDTWTHLSAPSSFLHHRLLSRQPRPPRRPRSCRRHQFSSSLTASSSPIAFDPHRRHTRSSPLLAAPTLRREIHCRPLSRGGDGLDRGGAHADETGSARERRSSREEVLTHGGALAGRDELGGGARAGRR